MRKFKHKKTGNIANQIVDSNFYAVSVMKLPYWLILESGDWEEVTEKNPLKLEVGKEYILQYVHSKSNPTKVKITRFTSDGYPWMVKLDESGNGIVSPDCYKLIEEVTEKDYEILAFRRITYDSMCYTNIGDIIKANEEDNEVYPHPAYKYLEIYSVKRLSDGE